VTAAPDVSWLASAGWDDMVRSGTWPLAPNPYLCRPHPQGLCADRGPAGSWLASASTDGTVRIWNLFRPLARRHPFESRARSLLFSSPEGRDPLPLVSRRNRCDRQRRAGHPVPAGVPTIWPHSWSYLCDLRRFYERHMTRSGAMWGVPYAAMRGFKSHPYRHHSPAPGPCARWSSNSVIGVRCE
jgi:WD40 repeat protein